MGVWLFCNVPALPSVTFEGTIPSSGFSFSSFYPDLRIEYYATNPTNGTPGTYTRRSSGSSVWTMDGDDPTPEASDFNIGNLLQEYGSVTPVTITPKEGKSNGVITIYYLHYSLWISSTKELPTNVGTYGVIFDVEQANGWKAVNRLYAGTLTIEEGTPKVSDFNIGNLLQEYGNVTPVTITPKSEKSTGDITIYYNGSTTLPTNAGIYVVAFNVGQANNWKAVNGLSAGTLTIKEGRTPKVSDFNIGNLLQEYGNVTPVTITPKSEKSTGDITIYYNGSTTLPTNAGIYVVAFNVGQANGWKAINGLSAGTLTIEEGTPKVSDFNIGNLSQIKNNGITEVTITPESGKSNGNITIYYDGSTTLPKNIGTYSLTFDVKAASNWKAANGLSAGTLTIRLLYASELSTYLSGKPDNDKENPYLIEISIVDTTNFRYLQSVLNSAKNKYVYLDFSGSTVTTISNIAFRDCTSLTGVTIGNSVTSIGEAAFVNCTSLTGVTIGNSVTSIGASAFLGCTNLTSITIPDSVTSIGKRAFEGCTSLTSVTIPNSVTSIGDWAFVSCTSLTSVSIGNSVTSIENGAFNYCTSLNAINVDVANTAYISQGGVLYNKSETTLIKYPPKKTGSSFIIIIPDSVTSIGASAFLGCTNLTSITIPDSVTSIGKRAFEGCTSLTSVTIPNSVTSIGENAFRNCTSLTSVTFQGIISSNQLNNKAFSEYGDAGYIGDLRTKYLAGGKGTYTRSNTGNGGTWTKQQ